MMTRKDQPFPVFEADPTMASIVDRCLQTRRAHYCTASFLEVGEAHSHIHILLDRGTNGLHVALTPDGAREIIESLLSAIASVETRLQAEADTQLAATLAKGNPE